MNPPTANPPIFGQTDLSYPIQSPYVSQQAYERYGSRWASDGSALQTQSLDGQVAASQNHILHSFDPSPALYRDAESFDDTQVSPAIPMGPPTKPRKRKAPTLRADAWEPYKTRIVELHITQGLKLREVKKMIEKEFGFTAELRQYRTRITQWGKDKNIKPSEMSAIVRKQQQRKLIEVNKGELVFEIRGYEVEPQKIDRWMKRHEVPESLLYAPSPAASTPSAVYCRTISERGSPVPSPTYSAQTPNFSLAGIMSIPQSPAIFSPAPSVSSIVRPQGSTFTGQSPAPIYRSLPSSLLHPLPALNAFQGEYPSVDPYLPGYAPLVEVGSIATGSLQYRYKQTDEEHMREELTRAENSYGTNHAETLGILSKLGNVLMHQGRYRAAEKAIRRLVEGRQIMDGNNDVNTLGALDLLGKVLGLQGLYAKAEKLHRRTLESKRDILGGEHPFTLNSIQSLASTYANQGRWKEAEELGVQVIEKSKRVLGDEHPDTLTRIANLAFTLKSKTTTERPSH